MLCDEDFASDESEKIKGNFFKKNVFQWRGTMRIYR